MFSVGSLDVVVCSFSFMSYMGLMSKCLALFHFACHEKVGFCLSSVVVQWYLVYYVIIIFINKKDILANKQIAFSQLSNNFIPTLTLSLLKQTVKRKGNDKVQQTKIDMALCCHLLSSVATFGAIVLVASGAVVVAEFGAVVAIASGAIVAIALGVIVAAIIRESNFSDFPNTISI